MSQLHALTHEKAVIDDVAVRQRSTLGKPSGPTGELDVDRIVRLQHLLQALDLSSPPRRVLPHPETDEIQESALHQGDSPIRVEEASLTSAETERNDPAPELPDHCDVITALETLRQDQGLTAHLVQSVFEFRQTIGGIDVHQDQPRLGGRELGDDLFNVVG